MQKLAKILSGSSVHPYIIAEISANHNGSIDNAKSLILAAKLAGADAIKLQTFTAESITVNSVSEEYSIPTISELWGGGEPLGLDEKGRDTVLLAKGIVRLR